MDGTGLSAVPDDDDLARRLVDKTNDLNDSILAWSVAPVALFAACPLAAARTLVGGAAAFAALWILADLEVGAGDPPRGRDENPSP